MIHVFQFLLQNLLKIGGKLLYDKPWPQAGWTANSENDIGIFSVVSHIEIAEKHYGNGKIGDDYLFNDAIYRCNQAFEGALKEAYRIVAGKNPNKLTPDSIEKYFEENNVLKERVLQLFTNYRKEWRNKSTHDYKLYFSEQEAFLGIVNISAFINILLDQMVGKRAYDKEADELKKSPVTIDTKAEDKPILDRVTELLLTYSKEVPEKTSGSAMPRITEVELIGTLSAFLDSLAKDISVFPEFSIPRNQDGERYYADFLLQQGEEKLIIEIKNPRFRLARNLDNGTNQLLNYLTAAGVRNGILYIPPLVREEEIKVVAVTREIGSIVFNIVQIYPEGRGNKSIQPTANASVN